MTISYDRPHRPISVTDHRPALQVRRERELAAVLGGSFGLVGDEVINRAVGSARWRRVSAGDAVCIAGERAEVAWLVLTGRLILLPEGDGSADRTVFGRGGMLGGAEVMAGTRHRESVIAARDSLLAGFDAESLTSLLDRRPDLAMALALGERTAAPTTLPPAVVAVVVGPGIDRRVTTSRLAEATASLGPVELLWAERVRHRLGVDQGGPEDYGVEDLSVRRFLHDLEDAGSHVLLEVETHPTSWTRLALSAADEVLVFVRPELSEPDGEALLTVLDHAPLGTRRTLAVTHPANRPFTPRGTGELIDALNAGRAVHLRTGSRPDMARLARLLTRRGCGLVLGGGGARGFAHLGVYPALVELGVEVDVFGGSSIGSPLATAMADEIPPDELDLLVEERFARVLDFTIPVVSLVKGGEIAAATADTFSDRELEDLRRSCFCLSTNLTASRQHVHRRGPVVHAVRASCAIPGVMPPVPHGPDLLVDAGLTNNLPVDVMRDVTPHGDVIAVDVAPPTGPRAHEDFGLSVSGLLALRPSVRRRRTYPRLSSVLFRSLIVGSEQHTRRRANLADCHLALDLRGTSTLAFRDVQKVAKRGYESAMPLLERWLETKEEPRVAVDVS